MKYRNIIFDFGNVLATFDAEYIMKKFWAEEEDLPFLMDTMSSIRLDLDEGTLDYHETMQKVLSEIPAKYHDAMEKFFLYWYREMPPILDNWKLARELKAAGYGVYLLSNADMKFAEECLYYDVLKLFDGIIISAVVKCNKPKAPIYHALFDTYHLDPKDCFFIDDREENIEAGRALGMEGIVFTGDVKAVRDAIDFPECEQIQIIGSLDEVLQ